MTLHGEDGMANIEHQPTRLWVCDHCADLAEDEPGATCEVCCEGTIRAVEYVPASQLREAVDLLREFQDGYVREFGMGHGSEFVVRHVQPILDRFGGR